LAIGALREVDDAHAAAPELAKESIGTNLLLHARCVDERAGDVDGVSVENAVAGIVRREERLDLGAKVGVVTTCAEPRGTFLGRLVERAVEQVVDDALSVGCRGSV